MQTGVCGFAFWGVDGEELYGLYVVIGERGEGEDRRMKETGEVKKMKNNEWKQKKTDMGGDCEKKESGD